MKKLLSILLFFVAILPVVGQSDSLATTKPAFKNQLDLDVQFLGVEFSFKRKLSQNIFSGVSLGIGPAIRFNWNGQIIELYKLKYLTDFQLSKGFHIYQAFSYARVYSSWEDDSGEIFGIELGFFIRIKKIALGYNPSVIFFREDGDGNFDKDKGIVSSLIVLKIPLKRW